MSNRSRPSERELINAGYRYALSLTHHRHDAEDIAQQACLNILRVKGRLTDRRYLFVTVRNLFIERQRRSRVGSLPAEQCAMLVDPVADHETATDNRWETELFLGMLTVPQRETLFLNCVEGYSAAEIAELTRQPRNTVLSHLSRAKARLRELAASRTKEDVS